MQIATTKRVKRASSVSPSIVREPFKVTFDSAQKSVGQTYRARWHSKRGGPEANHK